MQSNLAILQASLTEVSEGYFLAVLRADHHSAREWRKLVIERSLALSAALGDSQRIANADRDDEGRRGGAV